MYDLAIVDGNNMFHKAWSVHRNFSVEVGDDTVYTGGTFGLVNSLVYLKKKYVPKGNIVVCWDRGHKRRTAMFPEYKGTRPEKDPDEFNNFIEQMKMAQYILGLLGIHQSFKDGEEADDIVGTLSKTRADKGLKVLIMSADKDFKQLIDHNIDLLAHKGKDNTRIWTDIEFEEENGFHPTFFTYILALMGDSGDNIPGVQGIGEKGATKLVTENLELLVAINNDKEYKHLIPEKQVAAMKKLLANIDSFKLSYKLAKIDRELKGIKIKKGKKDMSSINDLFEMYQFNKLLQDANWKILEVI